MGNWRHDPNGAVCWFCGLNSCYCCPECGNHVADHRIGCKSDPNPPSWPCGRLEGVRSPTEKTGLRAFLLESNKLQVENNRLLSTIVEMLRANRDGTGR